MDFNPLRPIKQYIGRYLVGRKEFDKFKEEQSILSSHIIMLEQTISKQAVESKRFSHHYDAWREKRVTEIIRYFGPLWFRGKKLLEVGCGYGEIGLSFEALGAEVHYSDARQEHLDVILKHRPYAHVIKADINNEWPFDIEYDLILHLGVLYHLDDIDYSLSKLMHSAKHAVLETEVSDSISEELVVKVIEDSESYDQSTTGVGSRPSPAYIEKQLKKLGANKLVKLESKSCDSTFHQYSWPLSNTGRWEHGLRALWFIEK